MRIVVLGLSLSSSWGNGHATTWRALLRAMAARGHEILFLERDQPWYASNRDLTDPDFCELALYDQLADLDRFAVRIGDADAVIVGSFVPEGADAIRAIAPRARGLLAFYDIDTPVTMRKLDSGDHAYVSPELMPLFDLYLSFTGGPTLRRLERQYGARMARALYCAVDPQTYHATGAPVRWALGYLGTYSDDRQPLVQRLLIDAARMLPGERFVVAGPLYPDSIEWPANVDRIEHLPPAEHAQFYSSLRWALNVTRADMSSRRLESERSHLRSRRLRRSHHLGRMGRDRDVPPAGFGDAARARYRRRACGLGCARRATRCDREGRARPYTAKPHRRGACGRTRTPPAGGRRPPSPRRGRR